MLLNRNFIVALIVSVLRSKTLATFAHVCVDGVRLKPKQIQPWHQAPAYTNQNNTQNSTAGVILSSVDLEPSSGVLSPQKKRNVLKEDENILLVPGYSQISIIPGPWCGSRGQ